MIDFFFTNFDYFEFIVEHENINLKFVGVRDKFDLITGKELGYDNVIILPVTSKTLGPRLKPDILLDYFNAGGNLLAFTSEKSSPDALFEFFKELDINIAPKNYEVVDHFGYSKEKSFSKHNILELKDKSLFGSAAVVELEDEGTPLLYRGSGAYLGSSPHVLPILKTSETAYVYDTVDEANSLATPWVSGSQTYLAAGFQGLNNARAVWIGGGDSVLSNEYLEDSSLFNIDFIEEVSKWTFQEKSVIRATFVDHYPADHSPVHTSYTSGFSLYKINQDVTYSIGFQEWTGHSWVPYLADDIQTEFVMLDPYYRLNLGSPVSLSPEFGAIYNTSFKIPDQHGIFSFKTDYKRPGLSYVETKDVVTVRHNANDEWPRSWKITNSWIYLSSFVAVVGAWMVFVPLYLFMDNGAPFSETAKKLLNK